MTFRNKTYEVLRKIRVAKATRQSSLKARLLTQGLKGLRLIY